MKNKLAKKAAALLVGGVAMIAASAAMAHPIRTPEGNLPMIHWAVVESTPGDMAKMGAIAAATVGPTAAGEAGTYALYGGIDEENPDVLRLLEIYESYEAYRIHSTSEAFQEYRAQRFPILKSLKILEANAIVLEQKAEGVGTVVFMHRYEVRPERLAEYQHAVKEEAIRAVRDDDGVLGMFVTAEHDAPNIIHTMEIYRDETAYERYVTSEAYGNYLPKLSSIFLSAREIKNQPSHIVLSAKGLRVSGKRA
ncbi:MAG: antibiotic biosynthesis monooxygenase [Schwartzia sp.]|nr:antibiotic biosynthesis monooxygenase [Schwartzia sp. (in: firmicutes)]